MSHSYRSNRTWPGGGLVFVGVLTSSCPDLPLMSVRQPYKDARRQPADAFVPVSGDLSCGRRGSSAWPDLRASVARDLASDGLVICRRGAITARSAMRDSGCYCVPEYLAFNFLKSVHLDDSKKRLAPRGYLSPCLSRITARSVERGRAAFPPAFSLRASSPRASRRPLRAGRTKPAKIATLRRKRNYRITARSASARFY